MRMDAPRTVLPTYRSVAAAISARSFVGFVSGAPDRLIKEPQATLEFRGRAAGSRRCDFKGDSLLGFIFASTILPDVRSRCLFAS